MYRLINNKSSDEMYGGSLSLKDDNTLNRFNIYNFDENNDQNYERINKVVQNINNKKKFSIKLLKDRLEFIFNDVNQTKFFLFFDKNLIENSILFYSILNNYYHVRVYKNSAFYDSNDLLNNINNYINAIYEYLYILSEQLWINDVYMKYYSFYGIHIKNIFNPQGSNLYILNNNLKNNHLGLLTLSFDNNQKINYEINYTLSSIYINTITLLLNLNKYTFIYHPNIDLIKFNNNVNTDILCLFAIDYNGPPHIDVITINDMIISLTNLEVIYESKMYKYDYYKKYFICNDKIYYICCWLGLLNY